jgi:hypothetical protein
MVGVSPAEADKFLKYKHVRQNAEVVCAMIECTVLIDRTSLPRMEKGVVYGLNWTIPHQHNVGTS